MQKNLKIEKKNNMRKWQRQTKKEAYLGKNKSVNLERKQGYQV